MMRYGMLMALAGLLGCGSVPHDENIPRGITLRGLSVYALNEETNFPVVVRDSVDAEGRSRDSSQYLTIQFDVLALHPPELKIRFLHCSRDWRPDNNVFVQDPYYRTSFLLDFRVSPLGVDHYRYRYINRFPDTEDAVRFEFSGNWLFQILDKEESTVLAEGRFFVVDRISPTRVTVVDDYLTEAIPPLNQIHKVTSVVRLPDEREGIYYITVDIYQNRRLYHPYRIDAYDRNPYTRVDGYNTGTRVFTISDLHPGNEYRTLDLSSPGRYPNRSVVRLVEGADQMRSYWRTGPDRNGTALLNPFSGINSDYLEVVFRLDLTESDLRHATAGGRGIFLAGPFNQWFPSAEDRLIYRDEERSLAVTKLLRRGVYDYQYVTGILNDDTGIVERQDWLAVEGNDWRTRNTYHVMVYYNDPRFGGFDRIVGFAQTDSMTIVEGPR